MRFIAEFCEAFPLEASLNGYEQGIIRLEGPLGTAASTDMRVGKTVMLLPSLTQLLSRAADSNPWGLFEMISSSFTILIEGTKKPGKFTVSACGTVVEVATTAQLRCDLLRDMSAFWDRYKERLNKGHPAVADFLDALACLRNFIGGDEDRNERKSGTKP